jgi:hypothetical protein
MLHLPAFNLKWDQELANVRGCIFIRSRNLFYQGCKKIRSFSGRYCVFVIDTF